MAPVTNLGLLAFASAALAVPHIHEHARMHHHRRGAPPVYGGSSAAPVYGGSSVAAASGSASVPAYGGSSSFVAAVSGSAIPSYGASASGGFSYPAGNSSWGYATGTAGATGYSGSGSISICTETSTLIYRTSTEYSTYYVTHTLTPESAGPSSVAAASVPVGSGAAGFPSGSAPAGSEAAACTPDVTVTTTVQQTVTVQGGGAPSAPASSFAAVGSSEAAAIPSAPAKVHGHGGHHSIPSKAPPAPESSAPSSPESSAPSSPESSAAPPAYSSGSAPSSAPSSPPSGSGSGALSGAFGGKRGLAYNEASLCDAFTSSKYVGWAYNWASSSSGLTSSIPFVPMLWGTSSDFTGDWMANAKSAIAGGAPYLFSFNEPDMPSQANLLPSEAASAWKQYMEPFAGQAKLVAPSVTNSPAANQGIDWLNQFLGNCSGCTIDAVNQHWYDSAGNDMSLFKSQIGGVASSTGKSVFVSEFGFIGSDSEISSALETAMAYMDSSDAVLGYSYFMVEDGILLDGTSLSSIGETYCNDA